MFKRSPLRRPFGRAVLSVHTRWTNAIGVSSLVSEPQGVVLDIACAGAAVALGGFGTELVDKTSKMKGDVGGRPDYMVKFSEAIRNGERVEAAFRVATWSLVAQQATYFWRPNYDIEISEIAKFFGFANIFEETVVETSRPLAVDSTDEERAQRAYDEIQASLYCMIGAALDFPVEPVDAFVHSYMEGWRAQVRAAHDTATERLRQLAPEGLPIWQE